MTTLTAVDRLLFDEMEDGPVLVIAPKRVAENTWSKEAAKWEHLRHLRVRRIMGTARQRMEAVRSVFEGPFADIYVINRENVVWLTDTLGKRWPFPIVVIDELSSFKSASAKRWRALRRVRGRIRRIIGLTGTPRPNGLEDLWPEIYLLDQGERLGRTLGAFRAHFLLPEKMNGHIVYSYRPRDGAEAEVYERLSDICMSIRKEDVLRLPGQIYETVELDAPPALLRRYKQFEREKVLECLNAGGGIVAGTEAALTNKLLQFANGAIYDTEGQVHPLHEIKLDALEELTEAAGGESVLVLYAYRHDAGAHPAAHRLPGAGHAGGHRRLEPGGDPRGAGAPGEHRPRTESAGRRAHHYLVRAYMESGTVPAGQRAAEPPRAAQRVPDLPSDPQGHARRAGAALARRQRQGTGGSN